MLRVCHNVHHQHTTTILPPFFRDHPGEPVPEENFWTLRCKGRLTEADTLTIRLGATPSGLTSAHLHHPRMSQFRAKFNSHQTTTNSLLTAAPHMNPGWLAASLAFFRQRFRNGTSGDDVTGWMPFPTEQCQSTEGNRFKFKSHNNDSLIESRFLRPTRHKLHHFRDVLPSHLNLAQQKRRYTNYNKK